MIGEEARDDNHRCQCNAQIHLSENEEKDNIERERERKKRHYHIEDLPMCKILINEQRNREMIQSKEALQILQTYSWLNEQFPVLNEFQLIDWDHHVQRSPMLVLHSNPSKIKRKKKNKSQQKRQRRSRPSLN